MSEITNKVVKRSKSLAKKATSRGKKIARDISKGTEKFLHGTIESSSKIAKDISSKSKNVYKQFKKGNITEGLKGTGNIISNSFGEIVNNTYLNIILKVLIALYTAFAISKLSKGLAYFFDNLIVKILFALLIVYLSSKDPSLSILIALSYILTLQQANKYRLIEKSQKVEPTFNNEYFNYDNDQDLDSSNISSETDKNTDNLMQNNFNERPDSLNQNYQVVTDNKYENQSPESEVVFNEASNQIYQNQDQNQHQNQHAGQGNVSTTSENHVAHDNLDPVLSTPHPVPVESSSETHYQTLDNNPNSNEENIQTPENENLDYSSRLFDKYPPQSENNYIDNASAIQGYQEDGPQPYSTGDLGFSNL